MPSARLPPTTGDPPNDRTHVRPSPDGLPHPAVVPAPAPLRPASVNAPAPSTTARSNVTVSDVILLRWADPSLTVTDVTAGGMTCVSSAPASTFAPDTRAKPAPRW